MTAPPVKLGPVARHRRPLTRAHAALAAGKLRVGFLGGSITAPKTGTRWPESWLAWLGQWAPGVRPIVENAALGATGSDLAVFRVGSEIIARKCDLVFVEYAVNDYGQAPERRGQTREGVLRQLLAAGCDVVLVYTFCPEMLPDMEAGRIPASIAEFEVLAEHYGVGSVWAGLHGWDEVKRGLMTWAEWLPDGLHPESRGSLSYAQSVSAFCEKEWICTPETGPRSALPVPRHPHCWETVSLLPLEEPTCTGPWTLRRGSPCSGMNQVLHCTAAGARLNFSFIGRGLVLGFDFGRQAGEVSYQVDGGIWQETQRDRPSWAGDNGWYRPLVITDTLPPGRHEFTLTTRAVPVAGGMGAVTSIGLIGLIQ